MTIPGLLLAVLESVLEAEALVLLLHDFGLSPFWRVLLPLGAHLLALAMLAVGLVRPWNFRDPGDRAWAVLGLSLTMPLPLFGFLGFLAIYAAMHGRKAGGGDLLKDFQQYISYDPIALPERGTQEPDLFLRAEVDIAPMREILAGDDVPLKRGAILSLSRLPRAEAVVLLKQALQDESREIRYYASNALSEMEKEFNDRIFRLTREVERNPTQEDRHVELARTVLEYTASGLLDQAMIPYFHEIAQRTLDRAALNPRHSPVVDTLLVEVLRRMGRQDKAREVLEGQLDRENRDAGTFLSLAEIAFHSGHLGEARRWVQEGLQHFPEDPRLHQLQEVLGNP